MVKFLALNDSLPEIHTKFLSITYFANPGIAFSIPLPQTLTLIITGILIIIFGVFFIKTIDNTLKIALASALLGAGSNFIDRLITGYTTDYIIFFSRSAMNIADFLIIAGIGYCVWYYQKTDVTKR